MAGAWVDDAQGLGVPGVLLEYPDWLSRILRFVPSGRAGLIQQTPAPA